MVLPVGSVGVAILESAGGLFWSTTFACSAIKSLTEVEIGQCSPW